DLHNLLRAFREVLLPDLDEESFADMYAQTVCYGLFAGICNAEFPQTFARENAADNLPATNPFLRRLFHHIVGPDLHSKVREDIERIVFLLKHADIAAILKDFGKRTRQEDPVVHFYETFLAQYDPKLRKSRGVYYTPEPVVSYIVRSVDHLLKEKFGKKEGLADPSVIVLDPACGTGTFLYSVIKLIHERVEAKGQYGAWNSYVRNSLLPRIFGFELLMAPYAVAHLKLGLLLKDTGYDFSGDERLGVYLTNTLEEAAKKSDILFAEYISEEANAATEVKKDKPVMVVLGNPPYSGISANMNEWIDDMLHGRLEGPGGGADYYSADGKPLGERKVWLQDDYVKFVRWSQWRLERTGAGIHAYISNHGYLDNPTFRGMRQQLTTTYNTLYLLDLHGNVARKERCPDGSKDENVFDIQQGVAIGIFMRSESTDKASVQHSELWGQRQDKYRALAVGSTRQTSWTTLRPRKPYYFFVPRNDELEAEYSAYWSIAAAMPTNSVGMVTARDGLNVHWDPETAFATVKEFAGLTVEDARDRFSLGKDVQSWSVAAAQKDILDHGLSKRFVRPMLYRPFDIRHMYYTGRSGGLICRPLRDIMYHVLTTQNLGLVFMRQVALGDAYSHFGVSRVPVDNRAFYSNKGIMSFAPLYLEPNHEEGGLFASDQPTDSPGGRRPNLSPEFIKEFSGKLGLEFVPEQPKTPSPQSSPPRGRGGRGAVRAAVDSLSGPGAGEGKGEVGDTVKLFGPEDVFNYIYAIFHSPTYRKRYAEFLKIDFPRVPLTSDVKLFRKLCALGGELVALHLMESPLLDTLVTKYPKPGNNAVERVSHNDETKRVYINEDQYFEGIRPEEWEFHIGGYQVLDKWLKDRKKAKRTLSADDIRHYQRIVVAIHNTIRLMAEIDKAIPKWPIE
ncbi:MAG: type ISP restriction/modification enzyme, partial [bacterium]